MSSKEIKPKSNSKSKEGSHKETEKSIKSVKSIKSDKSDKSSKSKSVKKSSDKDKDNKSKSKSPKNVKEVKAVTDEESKMKVNNSTIVEHNLNPVKDLNPYDSINLSSRPQFSPRGGNRLAGSINSGNLPIANPDKCDGCFDADAVDYCKECEKSFCSFCENQLHVVPVNRNHERIPITEMNHLKKLCYHHNNALKFYCDSCDEPICNECQILGPHNTKLHRIGNIVDTFKRKYQAMNDIVQNQLMKKSENLTSNLFVIDNKINELQAKEKVIEREIKKVYENMLDRLKGEEGKKTAMLNYESAIIQKELVQIGEVLNYLKDTKDNGDILGFLLRYKQLNENVESLISRQSHFEIDNEMFNLPNDIEIQNNRQDIYEKMSKLIKVKDDIIWNLLQGNSKNLITNNNISGNNNSDNKANDQTSKYNYSSSYGKSSIGNYTHNDSAESNPELAKNVFNKIKKNSINFYELLCGQEEEIGSQYINRKGLITALNVIGIKISDSDIDGLLMALNIKDSTKIPIKDLSLNLSQLGI